MTPAEKLGYKVGDKFKVLEDSMFTKDSIVSLYRDDGTNLPLFLCVEGYTEYTSCDGMPGAFEELKNVRRIKEQEKQMKKGWKFNVIAPTKEINFKELSEDVSKENPIALVHVEGDKGNLDYIVIYHKLLEKADITGWLFEDEFSTPENSCMVFDNACVYKLGRVEFNDVVGWAKKVKKTQYPDEYRNKAVVQVDFPRI